MIIGFVTGNVVATRKNEHLKGYKLLIVQPVGDAMEKKGDPMIALDTVGAGIGETVLILDEGTGARQVMKDPEAPVRTVIVGIIDSIDTYLKKGRVN